jgi:AraC-like DNA-binding protein
MAYDLNAVAREIDRQLSEGQFSLNKICEELGIHRHSARRALQAAFGCGFRQRRAFWQTERAERLRSGRIVTRKELAHHLGYASHASLKRRLRQLGIEPTPAIQRKRQLS